MTGAEPPLTAAAWSTAVGAIILGTITPDGAALLIVAIAGVALGIVTRRTLFAARAIKPPSWRIEAGLSVIEVFISVTLMVAAKSSGLGALWIGVAVGGAGAPLIERFMSRIARAAEVLIGDEATPSPPPAGPTTMFMSPGTTANIPAAAADVHIVDVDGNPPTKPSEIIVAGYQTQPPDDRMRAQLERIDLRDAARSSGGEP